MKIFIIPVCSIVRFPDATQILPKEGALVNKTTYWSRRIKEGSVKLGSYRKSKKINKLKS